jgi:BirA family biotin operon repressor/biotin-[acetyl-CoA-carboxylase] ligase
MAAVTWDGLDARELARRCGVQRVELFAETESTQDVAHKLADAGAPAGTVVLADAQTAGRGRLGRRWSSQPGRGVWCTIIERPTRTGGLDVLSLRVGLHCAHALDPFAGERVDVKWPNDLVLQIPRSARDDKNVIPSEPRNLQVKKLGGILVETKWAGDHLVWVAIGIGVNVKTPEVDGAAGLSEATDRAPVLTAIVRAVRAAAAIPSPLTYSELKQFAERDVLAGRRIVFPAEGIIRGITATGSLVVQSARGVEEVRSGTVRLAVQQEERA